MLVVKIYPSECFLYLQYKNDDAGPVSVFVWSYHPTVQVLQPAFAAMHGPHSLVRIGPGCADRA